MGGVLWLRKKSVGTGTIPRVGLLVENKRKNLIQKDKVDGGNDGFVFCEKIYNRRNVP